MRTIQLREGACMGAAVIASVVALSGCAASPESLRTPTSNFTKAMQAFAESAHNESLKNYRTEARRDLFLATVFEYLDSSSKNPNALGKALAAIDPAMFLCQPRFGYQRVATRLGNMEAIGAVLTHRIEGPSDDFGKLLAALGDNYAIKTNAKLVPGSYDAWQDSGAGKQCIASVNTADPFGTRDYLGKEFVAAIPAAKTLIDALWAVLKPFAVGTLQNVDLERRNAAVREYFQSPDSVNALKQDIADTETFLEREFKLALTQTAGRAVASAGILVDVRAPHWTAIQKLASDADCRANEVGATPPRRAGPNRTTCLNKAVAASAAPLEIALKAAEEFDKAMEKQIPDTADRLSAQIDTLRDIALGKQPPEAQMKALWEAASRYFALYQTADDTFSSANQKKINDAIEAFKKAIKDSN